MSASEGGEVMITKVANKLPSAKHWDDITSKVTTKVTNIGGGILVYLKDGETYIGLWDASGFYSVIGQPVDYILVRYIRSASKVTWFRVYKRKEARRSNR